MIPEILVSDLRQYAYCPRIVYYHYCLPQIRPVTYKMTAGQEAHTQEEGRERRRSLRAYHLADGQRYFNLNLESESLGLRGKVDMAIRRAEEVIPVEYKDSPGRMGKHILLQLAAYGMLLAEKWGWPAARGFVYYIPARRAREIPLTPELQAEVRQTVAHIQELVKAERMPGPPSQRRKCEICEFRRFCNDVV
ncbi:MAG: CRISPR-associated protein Cas4 [Chloroflexota bacterium]|nr:CRISPR-associated protein Cas4 [Chloroflexota bacterium]